MQSNFSAIDISHGITFFTSLQFTHQMSFYKSLLEFLFMAYFTKTDLSTSN